MEATPEKPAQSSTRRAVNIVALLLVLIGGILLPVLGWIIGVILLWKSPTWTTHDKMIGTFVVPGGLLLPAVIGALFVPGWGTCPGEAFRTLPDGTDQLIRPDLCEYEGIPRPWGAILLIALAIASIGAVIYLARRMRLSRTES